MDGTYSTIDEEWFDTQLTFGDIDIECAPLPSWLGVLTIFQYIDRHKLIFIY